MAGTERISADQFEALATLLRMRDSPARDAARRVLVEGAGTTEAARAAGTGPQNVHRAVTACRRGLDLARIAAGYTST